MIGHLDLNDSKQVGHLDLKDGSFVSTGCAYTVLQTVQKHGVYSASCGTVHYKEPLKSFEISVGHSPGFGLPSVATGDIAMIVQKAT